MSETQDNSEMDELERRRKELELEQAKLENERLREQGRAEFEQHQAHHVGGSHNTGGLAMASFVLGIVSLPTMFLYGFPGWVCGILALVFAQIVSKDSGHTVDAYRKARAGRIMGIISIGATCLFWFVVGIVGGAVLIIVFSILGLLGYLGFLAGGNRPIQYP